MTTAEVITLCQQDQVTPGQLTAALMFLSADYARKTDEFKAVLAVKATRWQQLRDVKESDKQADKAWDATAEGRLETSLRLDLKATEKLMSAIKTRLRTMETEARNQY